MIVVTGVEPGKFGAGSFVLRLVNEAQDNTGAMVSFYHRYSKRRLTTLLKKNDPANAMREYFSRLKKRVAFHFVPFDRKKMRSTEPALIVHFQTLGYRWLKRFTDNYQGPVWIYLMDSAFFCIRSYNHVPGEDRACLRCLGGDWMQATAHKCMPFVFNDKDALPLLNFLSALVSRKKVGLLSQNRNQAKLARGHFGDNAQIRVLGMWTEDVAESMQDAGAESHNGGYDVVFHGAPIDAKGFKWALDLALACPDMEFLFPCKADYVLEYLKSLPENITCENVTWETGLKEEVIKARLVLLPSLWSAPVEGALVKSIVYGKAVAVVEENTAFSSELPDDVVIKLPRDVTVASETLRYCINQGQKMNRDHKKEWCEEYSRQNACIMARITETVKSEFNI